MDDGFLRFGDAGGRGVGVGVGEENVQVGGIFLKFTKLCILEF